MINWILVLEPEFNLFSGFVVKLFAAGGRAGSLPPVVGQALSPSVFPGCCGCKKIVHEILVF